MAGSPDCGEYVLFQHPVSHVSLYPFTVVSFYSCLYAVFCILYRTCCILYPGSCILQTGLRMVECAPRTVLLPPPGLITSGPGHPQKSLKFQPASRTLPNHQNASQSPPKSFQNDVLGPLICKNLLTFGFIVASFSVTFGYIFARLHALCHRKFLHEANL